MKIVIYDGDCAFCNKSVLFILKKNKNNSLFVCSSQSEKGVELLKKYKIKEDPTETLLFIDNEKVFSYSGAVLRISKYLKGLYPMLYAFNIIPPFIRNWMYRFVSKRRKKLIKNNTCNFEFSKKYAAQIL